MFSSLLSNEEYKKIVDITTEIMCISYLDGTYKYVNPAYYTVFGYSEDEVRNLNGFSIVHPDDLEDINKKIVNAIKKNRGCALNLEYRYRCKDGKYKLISWNVRALLNENLVYSVGHDITEKKIIENDLIKNQAELKEAQQIANMGSWKWDLNSQEQIWSDEMYHIFGIDKNGITGRFGDVIASVIHPEDLHVFIEANSITDIIAKKTPFEYRIIGPNKSIRYIRSKTGDVIFDNFKRPVYMAGVVFDITESVVKDKEINQLREATLQSEKEKNESLEKVIEMKDEFLSLMSHEFKTPINVINAAVQAMNSICGNELSDKAKEYITIIKQNIFRQIRLVNNILDITRINSGHINIHKENIDIVFLTKAITQSVYTYATQKGINLSFVSSIDSIVIGIDEEKYERIILNVLSNAIKFTPTGKSVIVNLQLIKGSICIEVKDRGIGIPKDKLDIIFDKFGQVDSSLSRQAEGTGIGLSLAKRFVEALGGSITVKSAKGRGSTFTITLPSEKTNEDKVKRTQGDLLDNRLVQTSNIEFSDIYL